MTKFVLKRLNHNSIRFNTPNSYINRKLTLMSHAGLGYAREKFKFEYLLVHWNNKPCDT